jgi:pimeloyl-ACP methyl ester carboxylesterase
MPKVKVNGINMYYELHGKGDPVVLVQGLGGNHTFWEPNLPQLVKRHRIVLLDYRGAGLTDKPKMAYSTKMFADDIAGLMDALDIPKAHVVGRSMGGCIGQWLGIQHPKKLRSLILAATWGCADGMLTLCLNNWAKIVARSGLGGLFPHILPWCWTRDFFEPKNAKELAKLKRLVYSNRQPRDAFIRQSLAGQRHDAIRYLSRITAPTLVVVGEADILTPRKFSDEIVAAIPAAKLHLIPGLGHAFYEERPEVFNRVALDFWARH